MRLRTFGIGAEKRKRRKEAEKSVINHDDTSKLIDWLTDKSLVLCFKQIKQSDQMFESSKIPRHYCLIVKRRS